MTRVLLTGANGFVGRVLCEVLASSGFVVRAALRTDVPLPDGVAESAVVGAIGADTDWRAALNGVDAVMHIAARAHVLYDVSANSDLYFETNARGTACLADSAARAGVRRFVFLSSVKVNGGEIAGHAYTPFDTPRPQDAYGQSKWLAEQLLAQSVANTGLESVIVRSPLVYGPGVRANFLRMMHWVQREWPLPFGAVENQRSLVNIWNLCDLLVNLLTNPAAPGRTWMVSDGQDLSTPELVRRMGLAMRRRVRLLPVPVALLQFGGRLLGRSGEVARLCGSLALDIAPTRAELGWEPPVTVDEGIARTVSWYMSRDQKRVD